MTNQEALKKLKDIQKLYPCGEDSYKVIDYAIRAVTELPKRRKEAKRWRAKTLEQEPLEVEATELQKAYNKGFEDCRQAVLDLCNSEDPDYKIIHFKEDVECLPPVNPQETETWNGIHGQITALDKVIAYCKKSPSAILPEDVLSLIRGEEVEIETDYGYEKFEPQERSDKE